ncbi:MAG TPA: hypothetical protein VGH78_02165 [Solirubrobacteraceae bacterium]|jgi:hypothetical protein
MPDLSARLRLIPASASPEEAAAIVAALERFIGDTAQAARPEPASDPWRRAAILDGVSRGDPPDLADPWINT